MLKVEHTEVFNFEGALRGARNPLKSWDKSDSRYGCSYYSDCEDCDQAIVCDSGHAMYLIGENDMELVQTLVKAGSSHRKFIRQIFVSVDITAPFYWWKQFDQYKIGVVTNSESTMHCIHKKEFTLDDFSCEHLLDDEYILSDSKDVSGEYNVLGEPMQHLKCTIEMLNGCRDYYIATKDKKYWWQMIQLLPSSYNQKRTVTFDYENLRNMYHERKNHKLDEWHTFCEWIESLPYSELITMEGR